MLFNTDDILETTRMITQNKLDVRTITMGISLRDCGHPDIKVTAQKIYDKICRKAEHLVKTGEDIEVELGVPIIGTDCAAIRNAEDRGCFERIMEELGIPQPEAEAVTDIEAGVRAAARIGYPVLVRPSYVLGGRGMMIAYDAEHLRDYMAEAARISPDYPVYLDRFLEGAIESDVDALCDGEEVYIGGILEHIEEAGIHSGDSATCIPPFSFSESLQAKLRETTRRIAMALGVRGLVTVQYAIKGETVYVIEANPRASRTGPCIS